MNMSMRNVFAAVTAALTCGVAAGPALPAVGTVEGQDTRLVSRGQASDAAASEFMRRAIEAGQLETAAARLAIQKTRDERVRDLAYRLLEDHTSMQRVLRELARSRGVTVALAPTDEQVSKVNGMRGLQQQEFNAAFLTQIGVAGHRRSIELYREFLRSGTGDRVLRDFARRSMSILESHLRSSEQVQAQLAPSVVQQGKQEPGAGQREDAREQVLEAVQVVQRMKSDPDLVRLLESAQGVFILTGYGRAALGMGAQVGEGLLVTRNRDGRFGNPVFYNMAGLSAGAQAGASAGEVAFLLMTERAVQRFRSERNFSLNLDAGLTFAAYSGRGHGSAGKLSDVVVWSGTRGAYAGITLGVNGIMVDEDANRAYYGRKDATVLQILAGRIENPHHNVLGMVLGV